MQKTSNHGGKKKKMRANPTLSSSFPVDYDELGRGWVGEQGDGFLILELQIQT